LFGPLSVPLNGSVLYVRYVQTYSDRRISGDQQNSV